MRVTTKDRQDGMVIRQGGWQEVVRFQLYVEERAPGFPDRLDVDVTKREIQG